LFIEVGAEQWASVRRSNEQSGIASEYRCTAADDDGACVRKLELQFRDTAGLVVTGCVMAGAYTVLLLVVTLFIIDSIRSSLGHNVAVFDHCL
jgi:hypothetical protein